MSLRRRFVLYLLAVHVLVRRTTDSDDVARTVTFVALVLSDLMLIQANRLWKYSSPRRPGTSNPYYRWIVLGTLGLLGIVLAIPAITRLFVFEVPTSIMLLAGASVALPSLLWFEGVKRGLGLRRRIAQ